ncbi:MAG: vitamin B12 dependent-methionine synthase activation domain-containing protein, partial [Balneolaceae bacterium]|nr:vitamin B12 dependent-methionine synthase activation domain-containing protein [Balneolaceae bacterium]
PSLDEMVHVAKELKREKFKQPLLIGGATTSRIHTAVKIDPTYDQPVIHVLDASRSVSVTGNLVSSTLRDDFVDDIREEYQRLRDQHEGRSRRKTYLPIEEARENRTQINWKNSPVFKPEKTGIHVFEDYPLSEIRNYIDWGPFFITWQMPGKFPQILEDEKYGEEATKLYEEANRLLDRIVKEHLLQANGVIGLFPANSVGDDIEVYTDEKREKVQAVLHTLRQQAEKRRGQPNKALADYVAPKETGIADYIGGFAVTAGLGSDKLVRQFEEEHDDYHAILSKALADRLAEAFAELLHEKVRKEYWGYSPDEQLSNEQLIREEYTGIRPAAGYPAQPDHTEKTILFDLLKVEDNTGIRLTENLAMTPPASVSGLYFAHPKSTYFNVGDLKKDQIKDYAKRKGMTVEEVERWLHPNLNYEPEKPGVKA